MPPPHGRDAAGSADFVWRLAQLASLPFQERYVIGGTADEYVLDTELIENVDGLRFRRGREDGDPALSEEQRTALSDLLAYIDNHSGEALGARSRDEAARLMREGETWTALRSKAAAALRTFGLNAADLSVEEIDALAASA